MVLLQGELELVNTPSNSGKGQRITRCPSCKIAVWSNYERAQVWSAASPERRTLLRARAAAARG